MKEDRFYTQDSSGILSPALDIAYADDLLSGMSSLEGIQEKAKIVSAFSIIFGLDIATSKLRTFLHSSKVPTESLFFSIYTSGWVEHAVPICASGTLKALGMLYDISSPQLHRSQFLATKPRAERACNIYVVLVAPGLSLKKWLTIVLLRGQNIQGNSPLGPWNRWRQ